MSIMTYLIMVSLGFIFYGMSFVISKPHRNIILENTLPQKALKDPQVLQVVKDFRKKSLYLTFFLAIFFLPLLFISYDSIFMTYLFLGMFLVVALFYYLQIVYIKKMRQVKEKNNWVLPVEKKILVDTTLVAKKNQSLVSWVWFIPALLLNSLSGVFSYYFLKDHTLVVLPLALGFLMIGIFIILYYLIYRFPVRPITQDSQLNKQLNDYYRHGWSLLCVISAYIFPVIMFFIPLSVLAVSPFDTVLYVVLTLILVGYIVFTFWFLLHLRKKEDSLFTTEEVIDRNDDQYWRYGVYINPNDSRLTVPDRIGMNIGMNFGRPAGKIIALLLGLFIVGIMLFSTIPFFQGDFSDKAFSSTINQDTLILKAPLAKEATIPLSDITQVNQLDTLPKNSVRINGTATNHYLTGRFSVNGEKTYWYVYKDSPIYLEIKTKKTTYYFANKDQEKTEKLWEELSQK